MFFKIINTIENNNRIIENNTLYGLTENDLHDLKIIYYLSDYFEDNKTIMYLVTLFLFIMLYFTN